MGPQNSAAQAGDGDEQEEQLSPSGEQPQPVNRQRRNGPPNIVLIFADDPVMGIWAHTGNRTSRHLTSTNSPAKAPNSLNSTAVPLVPPARKTLMTGLHAGHTPDRDGSRFEPDTELLPRSLKNAGYRTGLFGKWGLNTHENGQNTKVEPYGFGFR